MRIEGDWLAKVMEESARRMAAAKKIVDSSSTLDAGHEE